MTTQRRRCARTSHGCETRLRGCTRRMHACGRRLRGYARRMRGCARTSTISEHRRVIGEICTRPRPWDACKHASAETRDGSLSSAWDGSLAFIKRAAETQRRRGKRSISGIDVVTNLRIFELLLSSGSSNDMKRWCRGRGSNPNAALATAILGWRGGSHTRERHRHPP